MSEILTESFCERCGTRYTFETARPKIRLKGVKVLSRGLKNFVLSDETTLDEAMAAARSEADREVTAHQLDAFHKTFNFCMSCRQYTCPNCWNEVEARCTSCAPHLGHEIMPAPFPSLAALAETTVVAAPSTHGGNGHLHDEAETETVAPVEAETVAEPEAVAAVEPAFDGPAEKASSQTAGLLRRFRPGQSLDDELAAYERELTEAEAHHAEPAQVAESAEAVEPLETAAPVEIEAEPIQAAASADEPVAVTEVEAEPEPLSATQPEPEPGAPPTAADVVEQPTWRIIAPDAESPTVRPPTETDATIPLQANSSPPLTVEPEWPARPEWPAPRASAGLPFLGRPSQPQGGVDALWAASNQELVANPATSGRSSTGIQPCISCGLSLSATAKFCRRCGTLQSG